MLVRDVMTPGVECVDPDETIQNAARRMRDRDIGPLPVCDNDRLTGVLTDRDIAIRAVAEGHDPTACRVRDVMTPGVKYCYDDQSVEEAEQIMENEQIRRLVVLNRKKRLVGILSLGDLALRTYDLEQVGEVLHEVSEPALTRA